MWSFAIKSCINWPISIHADASPMIKLSIANLIFAFLVLFGLKSVRCMYSVHLYIFTFNNWMKQKSLNFDIFWYMQYETNKIRPASYRAQLDDPWFSVPMALVRRSIATAGRYKAKISPTYRPNYESVVQTSLFTMLKNDDRLIFDSHKFNNEQHRPADG